MHIQTRFVRATNYRDYPSVIGNRRVFWNADDEKQSFGVMDAPPRHHVTDLEAELRAILSRNDEPAIDDDFAAVFDEE